MTTPTSPPGEFGPTIGIIRVMNPAQGAVVAPSSGCSTCASRHLCVPGHMTEAEIQSLGTIGFARRRLRAGDRLYNQGDRFQFIYAVRSGTMKSGITLADGREQVTGFHLAGDLIGLDAVDSGSSASAATALEDSDICVIPYGPGSPVDGRSAALQKAVMRLMSREIVHEHSLMMLLGSMNAEERLAAFVLSLSRRMKARGYSPQEFHLRMSRAEIGSYLGLTLETVSRTFSAFRQQGLLRVDKRHIRIDGDALERAYGSRIQ